MWLVNTCIFILCCCAAVYLQEGLVWLWNRYRKPPKSFMEQVFEEVDKVEGVEE